MLGPKLYNKDSSGAIPKPGKDAIVSGIFNILIESSNLASKCPILVPGKIASAARGEIIEENHRPELLHVIGYCTSEQVGYIVGQFLQQTLDTLR